MSTQFRVLYSILDFSYMASISMRGEVVERHAWHIINDEVMSLVEEELAKHDYIMSDMEKSIATIGMQKMMQFLLDNGFVKPEIKQYKGKGE